MRHPLAVLLAAWAVVAHGQDEADWNRCVEARSGTGRVEVCNRAIKSGRFSGAPLAAAHYSRASGYLDALGMEEAAMGDLDETVRLCAGSSERACQGVLFNALPVRAVLHQRRGEYDRALADIDHADRVRREAGVTKPDPGMAAQRGSVYLYKKDYPKAIELFDEAVAGNPGLTLPLYGRGVAKKRLGRLAEGESDIEQAKSRRADVDVLFTQRFGALPE